MAGLKVGWWVGLWAVELGVKRVVSTAAQLAELLVRYSGDCLVDK